MGFKTMEDQQRAMEAAAVENAKRATIAAVYQKFPLLVRCMANDGMIIDIVQRFAGLEALPSVGLFISAFNENPDAIDSLAQQSEVKTREQLTEDILSLLKASGSRHDSYTLKAEENRLKHFSIEALRSRLAEIKTKQRMASAPVPVLKAFVADARADKRKFPGFPELPKTTWNGNTHVPVNAAFFKSLDGFEIRRYTRLYSVEQVNQRIQEG